MRWEDSTAAEDYVVPDTIVDAVFDITCRHLHVDHAYALSAAVQQALPWFGQDEDAGLHTVHVPASGNGWQRPARPQDLLHLSRRTKLALRIPKARVADAGALVGRTLDVDGHALRIDAMKLRPLAPITTQLSRHVLLDAGDEDDFLRACAELLTALGIRPGRMLCGLATEIATPQAALRTRSLLIADLSVEDAVLLQQRGIGPERRLGCGLFLPHKDIDDLTRRKA